jgi:hypothetical protein
VKPDDAKTVSPTITAGAVDNGTGGVSKGVASVTTDIRNKNGDTVEANVTLSDPNGDGTWSNDTIELNETGSHRAVVTAADDNGHNTTATHSFRIADGSATFAGSF